MYRNTRVVHHTVSSWRRCSLLCLTYILYDAIVQLYVQCSGTGMSVVASCCDLLSSGGLRVSSVLQGRLYILRTTEYRCSRSCLLLLLLCTAAIGLLVLSNYTTSAKLILLQDSPLLRAFMYVLLTTHNIITTAPRSHAKHAPYLPRPSL